MLNIFLLLVMLYIFYLFCKFLMLSDEDYNRYRANGLSGGLKAALFCDNELKCSTGPKGIAMKNGKLIKKARYSNGETQVLFERPIRSDYK